ncbi:MAG: energy transducer TonB [Candidatus Kapabacteria bacterium]|nr:energy transducer TonB [Candidatus Kapabacteria bacterium]
MYVPLRDETQINFKIPWDQNTARGFGIAIVLTLIIIALLRTIYVEKPKFAERESRIIPLELINFGAGDGTGMSKGNLAKEGMAHQGANPPSELDDASKAMQTKVGQSVSNDPTQSMNIIAANQLSSDQKNNDQKNGSSQRNIGSPDGSPDGTGLGVKGSGPGLGEGLGDIEWGGGGNRVVLFKKIPNYPAGVNTNAQIKIRFTVSADGFVTSMIPMQKGDPVLERAAMEALRQWRFNPLKENKEMYGIITFRFRLS